MENNSAETEPFFIFPDDILKQIAFTDDEQVIANKISYPSNKMGVWIAKYFGTRSFRTRRKN